MPERPTKRRRLDQLLVERGLCESRNKAQRMILAGEVVVDEHKVDKPGALVSSDAAIRVKAEEPFVSRGGLKLQAALDAFVPEGLEVSDRVCLDVGASTGGLSPRNQARISAKAASRRARGHTGAYAGASLTGRPGR